VAALGVALGALALRLWGIRHGLPYVYNVDEQAHFVPPAIRFFHQGYNPHYFVNPPALTYLLHGVFAVWFRSGTGAVDALANDPAKVFLLARVTVAALGAVSVVLLYHLGRELFARSVGLLSAAMMAVAFIPVYYGHQALNDVATLVPVTLSLWGSARVLRRGALVDYLLAGAAAGLALATKYPGGIVLLPLLTAAALRMGERRERPRILAGVGLAVVAAGAAFLLANPFALVDRTTFLRDFRYVSPGHTTEVAAKPGVAVTNGYLYYVWTLTWGLGWIPSIAAATGSALLFLRDRARAAILVPTPLVFLLYMGYQGRFLARWLLPVYPVIAILAAFALIRLIDVTPPGRVLRPALAALVVVAATAQGLTRSIHLDLVLSRTDTRATSRDWIEGNVPDGSTILLEPIRLLLEGPPDLSGRRGGRPNTRWDLVSSRGSFLRAELVPEMARDSGFTESYFRYVEPGRLDQYVAGNICWIVIGDRHREVARKNGDLEALAYYRELSRRGEVVFRSSPFRGEPFPWNLDWSFMYYPFAFDHPGPDITVYRLTEGSCA
jgi:hypothetical protein